MLYQMKNSGDAKKVGTWRHMRLSGAVLGAAIIGLMLTPPQAAAGTQTPATSDQQIELALAAASNAQAAYDVFLAAANQSCLYAASCDAAASEPLLAADRGLETAAPSLSVAED